MLQEFDYLMSALFITTHVIDFLMRTQEGPALSIARLIAEQEPDKRPMMIAQLNAKIETFESVLNSLKANVKTYEGIGKPDDAALIVYKLNETTSMLCDTLFSKTIDMYEHAKDGMCESRLERRNEIKKEIEELLKRL